MLTKPPPISWWESNSASLHQTQGASTHYLAKALLQLVKEDDGTLMSRARRREARQDRRRR